MVSSTQGQKAVSVDTNVVGLVVSRSNEASAYRRLLDRYEIIITFFVQAEIRAHDWHPNERLRLNEFLRTARFLLPPRNDAINEFVTLKRAAVALGLRYGTEREDLWMLAQSKTEDLPVITNDRNAARVASACGMEVLTTLGSIRNDYARDRRRMARFRSI